MNFYTNVATFGNSILLRSVENGKRVSKRVKFIPSLFVPTPKPSIYKTINGEDLGEIKFGSINDAKEWLDKYKDVDNWPIFGNRNWEYTYIAQKFPGEIAWDAKHIRVANIDIEVGSENGFPDMKTADEPITAITFKIDGQIYAFGCGEYIPTSENINYVNCRDEIELIKRFIECWSIDYPDAVTGWYIKFFDLPYLIHRIIKVLGDEYAKKLSPWGYFFKREVTMLGKSQFAYALAGIATLDYLELYRKFTLQGPTQESYKLDYICSEELGEKKLSYEEYGSLHLLYKENFQKFMEYNIRDVDLIDRLDAKLKLLELVFTLAYDSKSNYDDVFMQVRMWDNIVYNFLWKKNIIIPEKKTTEKIPYAGAYVKEPILGMHKWVVSFDLTSLYPHLMMQYNISPDTLMPLSPLPVTVDALLKEEIDTSILAQDSVTLTPNGQRFTTKYIGFMPEILAKMFADRQMYKKEMIKAEKELEAYKGNDQATITEIKNRIARFNNLQAVKKICLNSCYGALGNEFFRFFDVRQAEAVTMAGQLSIRWIIKALNGYLNKLLETEGKDYVIASDTDSVYIVLDGLVDKMFPDKEKSTVSAITNFLDKACEKFIQPFIDKEYQRLAVYVNAYAQKMIMKREKICDVGICVSGKNYIWNVLDSEGVRFNKPKVKAVGLKMIKSNTPEVARKKLKEILNFIVQDKEKDLQEYVAEFKKEFKALPPEAIATPTTMNGLTKYYNAETIYNKGTTIHIKGSLLYNHFLRKKGLEKQYPLIQDGEKVKYVYLRMPNPLQDEVIAFSNVLPKEFGLHDYIDYELQFDKAFISPLKAVLDVIGWNTEASLNLEDFFK